MSDNIVRARQLTVPEQILTSGGVETGEPGEWIIQDAEGRRYLSSNMQFTLFWEETDIKGVYKEK